MKALLVIDYTNDFIAPNGALTCGDPGRKIDDRIKELADSFLKNGDYVIFPTDTHQKTTRTIRKRNCSRHITSRARAVMTFMEKRPSGSMPTRIRILSINLIKIAIPVSKTLIWTTTCARAESPNSGSAVFAPTSAYSTRQLLLTTSIIL